jgi:tetratricopeptide (TPR) repeat protein
VPKGVIADLRAAAPEGGLDDLKRAVGAAGDALASGDTGRACQLLEWAKLLAPRSAAVREAYGVASYAAGDFATAHAELVTYRRLTQRQDQNHLLADSARATGKPDKVAEYVEAMEAADVVPDRVAEGLIVLAGTKADRGDLRGALAVLEGRGDLAPERIRGWHPRLWYVAADLCERMGDHEQARDYFAAVTSVAEGFLDADERLAALEQ